MRFSRRTFLRGAAGLSAGLWLPRAGTAARPQVLTVTAPPPIIVPPGPVETLPPVALRGYGTLSATFQPQTASSGPASVLHITCDNDVKAALLHAKYLSDLNVLPGTEPVVLKADALEVPAVRVTGQGVVTAVRQGREVTILSAAAPGDLMALCQAQSRPADRFTSEATVPMYLDRWDRHGFLFYYRPWETPPSDYVPPPSMTPAGPGYAFAQEFQWARQHGGLGLIFWDDEAANDTAEGLMNEPWWDWAMREATAQGLPVHINTSASATTWLLNRYRDETARKMPGFVGNYYGPGDAGNGGQGLLSWTAGAGADAELGLIQSSVRRYAAQPNIVGWLEPHGELRHGDVDVLMEYGPVADASYRRFLKEKYKTLAALNARWHGGETRLRAWGDVRVPELASFLGWGPEALDLTGEWRVGYETAPDGTPITDPGVRADHNNRAQTKPAPTEWYQPDFEDSAWGRLRAPGDDRQMFVPKRPAVYRRTFDVPAAWRKAHAQVWLYVWDLSLAYPDTVRAFLNGLNVGDSPTLFNTPHWMALDVTSALREGPNHLALRLPSGLLAYRIYLSPHPPAQYPHLAPERNGQWVDFADWLGWSRLEMARRGAEMIRQIDPERPLTFMAPDLYADGIKALCERYGGNFHDTGYMGAFWADLLPALMRGAGLPFDLEPGGPPRTVPEFLHMMGLYLTEGIQGVSYFIHIGDVLWNAGIRATFEENLPLYKLIGTFHQPPADVAVLYSQRAQRLTDYPWGADPNVDLQSGYWHWNAGAVLRDRYPRDGVTEDDFASGNADKYKVVVDTNTSLMDEETVQAIERYVRRGGTFITFVQTGRHTPTRPDSWPIARLTGYEVTRIDRFDAGGKIPQSQWRALRPTPGQTIYADWPTDARANGLTLRRVAPECRDLLLWEDGTAAVGMRPLGKGYVVQVGPKFTERGIFDRIEPGGHTMEVRNLTRLFSTLLDWREAARVPVRVISPGDAVLLRHFVSNNGLHDIWVLWNQDREKAVTVDLGFAPGVRPPSCRDVKTGETVAVTSSADGDRLDGIAIPPLETRVFLSPRGHIAEAGRDWLALQRSWWRGRADRSPKRLPTPAALQTHTLPLTEDWAWRGLDGVADADIPAMALPDFDDAAWERRPLGVWSFPDHAAVKHGLFRRRFTVPDRWTTGAVTLWMQSWFSTTFADRGRIFLDGHVVHDWSADGLMGDALNGLLRPGGRHTLAVEIQADGGTLAGARGNAWLAWRPAPRSTLDLSGPWVPSRDALHDETPVMLPGPWDALLARRTVRVPREQAGRTAVLAVEAGGITGVVVNGRYLRRHHHAIGPRTELNITPWVHFGADNEIALVHGDSPGRTQVQSVAMRFYDPSVTA